MVSKLCVDLFKLLGEEPTHAFPCYASVC